MKRGKIEPIQKLWLSKDEAMAYLGCSGDYLDKLRGSAQISFAKDGKMIWYNLESINRFLNRMKVI
ncbi:DNA-binding protein [Bacteroides sp.]|uniref:DNA-binding protein n=1 Tax=Bacteroides sp. TaxID=29523 RepID=UPI002632C4CA|nr:DNA-binding protein [Bacteroides sp.]